MFNKKIITQPNHSRLPSASGEFYPSEPEKLYSMIEDFLNQTDCAICASQQGEAIIPQILILPHAGYTFSGKVLGCGIKPLQNSQFERIILIGRSHHSLFDNITADSHSIWETPLGNVELDSAFIKKIAKSGNIIKISPKSHYEEDSLEVIVPFLIKALGKEITDDKIVHGFKIVPLLFGDGEIEAPLELASILAECIDAKTLVIASSDLSHYPRYETANFVDKRTIEAIVSGDFNLFQKIIAEDKLTNQNVVTSACAEYAIITAMILSQYLNLKGKLLKYANSGDEDPANKARVVGYAAIGFYKDN